MKSLIVVEHLEILDLKQGKIHYKQDRNNYRRKGWKDLDEHQMEKGKTKESQLTALYKSLDFFRKGHQTLLKAKPLCLIFPGTKWLAQTSKEKRKDFWENKSDFSFQKHLRIQIAGKFYCIFKETDHIPV